MQCSIHLHRHHVKHRNRTHQSLVLGSILGLMSLQTRGTFQHLHEYIIHQFLEYGIGRFYNMDASKQNRFPYRHWS